MRWEPAAATPKLAAALDKQLAALDADLARFAGDASADPAFVAQKKARGARRLAAQRDRLQAHPLVRNPRNGSYFTLEQVPDQQRRLACDTKVPGCRQPVLTAQNRRGPTSRGRRAPGRCRPLRRDRPATTREPSPCADCHDRTAVNVLEQNPCTPARGRTARWIAASNSTLDCIGCHVTGLAEARVGSNLRAQRQSLRGRAVRDLPRTRPRSTSPRAALEKPARGRARGLPAGPLRLAVP